MIQKKRLILLALAVQVAAVWSHDVTLTRVAMLVTYPMLMVAALANGRLFGVRLMLAGLLLNFAVMAVHGGLMPVSPDALARAGGEGAFLEEVAVGQPVPGSKSVLLADEDTTLAAFADRFPVSLPGFRHKVVSAGDVLLAAGLLVTVVQALWEAVGPSGGRRLRAVA